MRGEYKKKRMLELEAKGLSRTVIAQRLNVTPSRVTKVLGAKKKPVGGS